MCQMCPDETTEERYTNWCGMPTQVAKNKSARDFAGTADLNTETRKICPGRDARVCCNCPSLGCDQCEEPVQRKYETCADFRYCDKCEMSKCEECWCKCDEEKASPAGAV